MTMATRRFRIFLPFIQYRRRYAQRRLVKDMGWRPARELIRG